ncbi:MAG: histidinol-phosphate transaminase [Halanaerobiales bacterium]
MSKYWSPITRNVKPYIPGEQPQDKEYIKLNTNENPYPPAPEVVEAIKKEADEKLRLYPDPACQKLREAIADYYNLNQEQVFVGNGSDEVLAFSFMTFFNSEVSGEFILFPDITYSFYPVYAGLYRINYHTVALNDDFSLPVEKYIRDNGGIIFPNPNAPTGKYLPLAKVEEIIQKNQEQVVIVDEAYIDFGGESAVKLIKDHPNLLVIQTFSKSRSLAGMRVGFALGQEHLITGIERIKNSFNSYTIDRVALAAATAAIGAREYYQKTTEKILNTREYISRELRKLNFNVIDSSTNFVFASPPGKKAEFLFQKLKEVGILVRYFDHPRINNYLRISIGTDEEMDIFLGKVKKLIN